MTDNEKALLEYVLGDNIAVSVMEEGGRTFMELKNRVVRDMVSSGMLEDAKALEQRKEERRLASHSEYKELLSKHGRLFDEAMCMVRELKRRGEG